MFAGQILIAVLAFTGIQAVSVEKVAENNMTLAQLADDEGDDDFGDDYYRGLEAAWNAFSRQDRGNEEFALGFIDGALHRLPKNAFAVWNSNISRTAAQSLLTHDSYAAWNFDQHRH